jgi:hypothetical protein
MLEVRTKGGDASGNNLLPATCDTGGSGITVHEEEALTHPRSRDLLQQAEFRREGKVRTPC